MTMKEATDFLIEDIMNEHDVSKAQARELLIKALVSNVVVDEIDAEVSYLLGELY